VLHDKVLTNANHVVRRLTYDPQCFGCGVEEETLDHMLRECLIAVHA